MPIRVFVANTNGQPDTQAQITFSSSNGKTTRTRNEGKECRSARAKDCASKDGVYNTLFTPDVSSKDVAGSIEQCYHPQQGDQSIEHSFSLLAATPKIIKLNSDTKVLPQNAKSFRLQTQLLDDNNKRDDQAPLELCCFGCKSQQDP